MGLFKKYFWEIFDPIAQYNRGSYLFAQGAYRRAGKTFARLLDDYIDPDFRLISAYACHLCASVTGKAVTIPDDLLQRSDEVGVQYATYTAAGLFIKEGRIVAVHDGQVDVLMGSDSFEIIYASTLNILSVQIFYISMLGKRIFVDDEADEVPTGKYAFVRRIATEAGSGNYPPVEIPKVGFPSRLR